MLLFEFVLLTRSIIMHVFLLQIMESFVKNITQTAMIYINDDTIPNSMKEVKDFLNNLTPLKEKIDKYNASVEKVQEFERNDLSKKDWITTKDRFQNLLDLEETSAAAGYAVDIEEIAYDLLFLNDYQKAYAGYNSFQKAAASIISRHGFRDKLVDDAYWNSLTEKINNRDMMKDYVSQVCFVFVFLMVFIFFFLGFIRLVYVAGQEDN